MGASSATSSTVVWSAPSRQRRTVTCRVVASSNTTRCAAAGAPAGSDMVGAGGRLRLPGSRGELGLALLPVGRLVDLDRLHGRHLVLGTIRRPVGVFRGDDVDAELREVERRVDDARLHPFGHGGAQHGFPGATRKTDPVAFPDATEFGVV